MSKQTYLNAHVFRKMINQGFCLVAVKCLVHLTRGKLHKKLLSQKIALVKRRIAKDKIDLSCVNSSARCSDGIIWVCWLQGESKMPPIIKLCYDSIKKHAAGHKVVLLTSDNLREWVNLPEKYYQLYSKGRLMAAQLADMVRINLLSQRGGLWLDATIFVLSDIPESYFQRSFYSMRYSPDEIEISRRRWTSFCLGRGGDYDPVFSKLAVFFDKYTENHNEFIDYFMIDYALDYVCDNCPDAETVISSLPVNNVNTTQL